jgi:hypothetical protein
MNINLNTWFSERELDYCPKHFVQTNTPITDDRHLWILETLKGRYHIAHKKSKQTEEFLFLLEDMYPFFEDPQEAVIYELKFS